MKDLILCGGTIGKLSRIKKTSRAEARKLMMILRQSLNKIRELY